MPFHECHLLQVSRTNFDNWEGILGDGLIDFLICVKNSWNISAVEETWQQWDTTRTYKMYSSNNYCTGKIVLNKRIRKKTWRFQSKVWAQPAADQVMCCTWVTIGICQVKKTNKTLLWHRKLTFLAIPLILLNSTHLSLFFFFFFYIRFIFIFKSTNKANK